MRARSLSKSVRFVLDYACDKLQAALAKLIVQTDLPQTRLFPHFSRGALGVVDSQLAAPTSAAISEHM